MSNTRDVLLFGMSQTQKFDTLMQWRERTTELHPFMPDYHRLQLEFWIWQNASLLRDRGVVIDVGVQSPRRWLGHGYRTMGLYGCDLVGDLRAIPLGDASVDAMIVTEVLEHCEDPFAAAREMHRVIKPGGVALVTSPFFWPWHGTSEYRDFWRFTHDGWQHLFKNFESVKIRACEFTDEGQEIYDLMRRFECWGHKSFTHATTGYLVTVRR